MTCVCPDPPTVVVCVIIESARLSGADAEDPGGTRAEASIGGGGGRGSGVFMFLVAVPGRGVTLSAGVRGGS